MMENAAMRPVSAVLSVFHDDGKHHVTYDVAVNELTIEHTYHQVRGKPDLALTGYIVRSQNTPPPTYKEGWDACLAAVTARIETVLGQEMLAGGCPDGPTASFVGKVLFEMARESQEKKT